MSADDFTPEGMAHADFRVGATFRTGTGRWLCTDRGARTIAAIRLAPGQTPTDVPGPPYEADETTFDEDDFDGCSPDVSEPVSSPALPPRLEWKRVLARLEADYIEAAKATRMASVCPSQTELVTADAYIQLVHAYDEHLGRLERELPRLQDKIAAAVEEMHESPGPCPNLEAACVEFAAHLRASAKWAERFAQIARPLDAYSPDKAKREVLAEIFAQLAPWFTALRAAAEGRPGAEGTAQRVDVRALIARANAADSAQFERGLKDLAAHTEKSSGCGGVLAVVFLISLGVLALSSCS